MRSLLYTSKLWSTCSGFFLVELISALFYFILFYFILFCFVSFRFVSFRFVLFYFILFYFILFYFILFYFILFYFILFYFILFYFILFYFILFYFIFMSHVVKRVCNFREVNPRANGVNPRSGCKPNLVPRLLPSHAPSCGKTLVPAGHVAPRILNYQGRDGQI